MPGGGFHAQRAVVISGPLAGPGLAHVGGRQRRPDRRGRAGTSTCPDQPRRRACSNPAARSLPGRLFSLRRQRFKISEAALRIELHIDHARHGAFGIVFGDWHPESASGCAGHTPAWVRDSADTRTSAARDGCGRSRPIAGEACRSSPPQFRKSGVVVQRHKRSRLAEQYSPGAESARAPCRPELREAW